MSATFKLMKKQQSQSDLRRLMQEQKSKSRARQSVPQCKIESPLAKYNDAGQLMCVLCKSVVRSESVWKVHINTKVHKENVELTKKLKDKLEGASQKRANEHRIPNEDVVPEKKVKTEASTAEIAVKEEKSSIPADFFDSNEKKKYFEITLSKTSIKKELVNIKREQSNEVVDQEKMDVDELKNEKLPEGFFDDPVKDAKVRNLEYKDPQDEEWERFQKEIKEQSTVSNAIIAEEQEEATAERQIEEIDEQIRKWSRVLDLEKKKEVVSTKVKQRTRRMQEDSDTDKSSDDDTENIDDFLDWRAKRLRKIQR